MAINGLSDIFDSISGAGKDKKAAQDALSEIEGMWSGLDLPEYENIDFVAPEYAGDVVAATAARPDKISVDPTEAAIMAASTVGPSAMQDISTDPRLREAQLSALSGLEGIAEAGGMTAQDEANMSRMINSVNQQDRGRREAIQQGMARRGMGGSGMELLAQLQSSQGATDRAAQQGLDIQGMAQARALEALMQSGQLGGSIRGQDFSEDAAKAQAADAIARFNAGQRQGANQFNTSTINSTNQFNTGMDFNTQSANVGNEMQWGQNTANIYNNVNTGNRDAKQTVNSATANAQNQSMMHNQFTIPNTKFGNQVTKAGGQTGAKQNMANFHQQSAQDDREALGAIATGAADIYTGGKTKMAREGMK